MRSTQKSMKYLKVLLLSTLCTTLFSLDTEANRPNISKNLISLCKKLQFSTLPEVPVKIGDSIPFKIYIEFPCYSYHKNTQIIIIPEIHFNNKIIALKTMRFKAVPRPKENKDLKNDSVFALLSPKGYTLFEHEVTTLYEPGIEKGSIEARITIIEGTNSLELPLQRISSTGFSTFSRLLEPVAEILPLDCEKENLCVRNKFNILFPVNQSDLGSVLNKKNITKFSNLLFSNVEFLDIHVESSASPEGEERLNENLAYDRLKSLQNFIIECLISRPSNPYKTEDLLNESFFSKQWIQRNWKSLDPELNYYNIPNGTLLKEIINSDLSEADKNIEVVKLPKIYNYLNHHVFPTQRYTNVEILSTPNDDVLITDLQNLRDGKNKKKLSVIRLLQMGMIANNDQDILMVYQKAIKDFPTDYRGYFMLGKLNFENKNYNQALLHFTQASSLNPKSAESYNNIAVCNLLSHKYVEALELLETAANFQRVSPANYSYALSKLGRHSAAIRWATPEPTVNKAIDFLMNKEPYEALKVIDKMPKASDKAKYLAAIAGAKINDLNLLCTKLIEAIHQNPEFRELARFEAEFNKYRNNPQFIEALKIPAESTTLNNNESTSTE